MTEEPDMRVLTRYSLFAMLLVMAGTLAQADGGIPCLDCPEFRFKPYPEAGIWHTPGEPGSGFMFEVQGGILAGYYYLYDDQGRPLWLMVSGPLVESDTEGVMWELETPLLQFSGGRCLDCDYTPAELDDSPGTIRLEFFQRNTARFQVDDQAPQDIVSLTYGTAVESTFEPHSDYLLPDLSGYWFMSFWADFSDASRSARAVRIEPSTVIPVEGGPVRRYTVRVIDSYPNEPDGEHELVGNIECYATASFGPFCRAELNVRRQLTYFIHPGNIGDARFVGEGHSEHGDTLYIIEGFRMRYD
jgi:hypothetical protein